VLAGSRPLAVGEQRDLLGADGEPPAVALEQVGDADERGDELVRRALVDLGRGADLVDPALAEDGDAVAIVSASSWSCVT
jgi:hypothetical protein